MTPSPGYAARVPAGIDVQANARALGILQGKGVRAEDVTPGKMRAAEAKYQRLLKAERERRIRLGLPITGSMPMPGEAPVVIYRPPWEA